MLISLAIKMFWWMLPKILASVVDQLGLALTLVERANTLTDPTERRAKVLASFREELPLPELFSRALLEICVILNSLGVTPDVLEKMEELLQAPAMQNLSVDEQRAAAVAAFTSQFPDVPEKCIRLVLQLALAKLWSQAKGGA
jgi:hypothetical protein